MSDLAGESARAGTELRSRAKSLLELVDYQDDSIVSRTIIGAEGGSVTLFAFDAGQGLSEHVAPFDALVYVYEGEAEVRISSSRVRVGAGELLMMPAHEAHALSAEQPFKMMLVMVKQ